MSLRQADQLAAAIRSPIATEKHQPDRCVQMVGQRPRDAGLIGESEVRSGHWVTLLDSVFGYAGL